jgi:hypothetical protein
VYHLELRQFPHNLARFNLDDQQLRAIIEPWARGQWVELGERKWSPHQAKLTILEGPRIPMDQLSMGRGWRNAQRQSEDVTMRLLAQVSEIEAPAAERQQDSASDRRHLADSLALELLTLLADAPVSLSEAWRLVSMRCPEQSPSECLALTEQAVRSLLRSRLIVLLHANPRTSDRESRVDATEEQEAEPLLRILDSWTGDGGSAGVRMRRA